MTSRIRLALVLLTALAGSGLRVPVCYADAGNYAAAGPHPVAVLDQEWLDFERDRPMPVRIYHPEGAPGPLPVIIFSHGLGGSRAGYEYLGRHWASHGYVSIHLQHEGSDDSVWRGQANPMGAMKRAANARNTMQRGLDVKFALDQVEALHAGDPVLGGRLDLERIGFSGHSFGSHTTLMAIGQVFVLPGGRTFSFADPRVKAAVALSPAPLGRPEDVAQVYGAIRVPCFHMTGTRDESVISDAGPADRRIPYDNISLADQYLLTLDGGDHMVFSGVRRHGDGTRDALHHDLIRMGSTAFWNAYLREDNAARAWLAEGGFAQALGEAGSFEAKAGTAAGP